MMDKPNIVFYFSDQQRWDTMGCYGQKLNVTPFLDSLAEEGTLFENAITCQPVCGPARSCLQTGKYPTETGCFHNGEALPFGKYKTVADYFNEAGYQTAYVGKWHLASQNGGADYMHKGVPEACRAGYKDHWMASDVLEMTSHGYNGYVFNEKCEKVEFTGYRPDCINNYAIDFIHSRKEDSPFFLFISQLDPHHQNDHRRFEGPDGSRERFAEYEVPGDLVGKKGDWKENYPDYLGQCHSLDQNVERLVDTLKEYGLWNNTIFIYTSDHGSHFCTRNEEYKRACHEACVHIPMIIHGPGFEGGKSIKEPVSLMDIPVTLLDCASLPRPEGYQGDSLKELVQKGPVGWKEYIFIQISETQIGRALRSRKWKYSVRAEGGGNEMKDAEIYYEDFLYDLEEDPYENNNLVENSSYDEVRAMLAKELVKMMENAGERIPKILPYKERPAAQL